MRILEKYARGAVYIHADSCGSGRWGRCEELFLFVFAFVEQNVSFPRRHSAQPSIFNGAAKYETINSPLARRGAFFFPWAAILFLYETLAFPQCRSRVCGTSFLQSFWSRDNNIWVSVGDWRWCSLKLNGPMSVRRGLLPEIDWPFFQVSSHVRPFHVKR